jgi:hypothetical protein
MRSIYIPKQGFPFTERHVSSFKVPLLKLLIIIYLYIFVFITMSWEGVQRNNVGKYSLTFSEIRDILYYPMNACAML